jgi:hypothetical protein
VEGSLAALRQALSGHFEKTPNRPLYLRQIRQMLRAVGSPIDERSGFRGLLDLLHQAQREGWLRLHRDRKGVWRVFPAAGPAPVLTTSAPAETDVEAEVSVEVPPGIEAEFLMPVETDVNWEAQEIPEEIPEPDEPPAPAVVPEAAPVEEAPPVRKAPRKRASKAGTKGGTRKASTRRKSKEPAVENKEQGGTGPLGP